MKGVQRPRILGLHGDLVWVPAGAGLVWGWGFPALHARCPPSCALPPRCGWANWATFVKTTSGKPPTAQIIPRHACHARCAGQAHPVSEARAAPHDDPKHALQPPSRPNPESLKTMQRFSGEQVAAPLVRQQFVGCRGGGHRMRHAGSDRFRHPAGQVEEAASRPYTPACHDKTKLKANCFHGVVKERHENNAWGLTSCWSPLGRRAARPTRSSCRRTPSPAGPGKPGALPAAARRR